MKYERNQFGDDLGRKKTMKLSTKEFEQLMQTVAEGWNEGTAQKAADCFSQDAIYVEPPDKQLYHGRAELYEFFGGDAGTDVPMKMTWHHLAFNEEDQAGFGEYTFKMHGRYHGIVVVKLESGLIKHWREYQYRSELDWEEFTNQNSFFFKTAPAAVLREVSHGAMATHPRRRAAS